MWRGDSRVISVVTETTYKACIRRTLTRHTLWLLAPPPVFQVTMGSTYKPPRAKIKMTPIFCFNGRFKLDSTGIGRAMIKMSVAILYEALKNHMNFLLTQRAGWSRCQKPSMGIHVQIDVISPWMKYATTTARTIQQATRILGPTNTRIYCRMIEIFVNDSEMLYRRIQLQRALNGKSLAVGRTQWLRQVEPSRHLQTRWEKEYRIAVPGRISLLWYHQYSSVGKLMLSELTNNGRHHETESWELGPG